MNDQLLDYLLERLEEPDKTALEERLQSDSALRQQLELLRLGLAPLAADQEIVPPPNLAARTIGRVAEYICRELPRAPSQPVTISLRRNWWRRADVLVAASLLVVVAGVALTMLNRMRGLSAAAARTQCQYNLHLVHKALKIYEDQHQRLPEIKDQVAGMIVPILQEAGVLSPEFSVRCNGQGSFQACNLTMEQIRAMAPEEFAKEAPNLLPSYAFTLGYRDDAGAWHSLQRLGDADNDALIFGDGPPPAIVTGNSLNHGGAGQNVLYPDGTVRFLKTRTVAGDDIYLNRANVVAAGLEQHDIVLGPSGARP